MLVGVHPQARELADGQVNVNPQNSAEAKHMRIVVEPVPNLNPIACHSAARR